MEPNETDMTEVIHAEAPLSEAPEAPEASAEVADEAPVEVKVRKKRTSKTWLVTVTNGTEEYVVTIKGVTSAEDAIARFESAKAENEVFVSVRPVRTFK